MEWSELGPPMLKREGDEELALHWIDRYAAGIDPEPQMDRIRDALLGFDDRQSRWELAAQILEDLGRDGMAQSCRGFAILEKQAEATRFAALALPAQGEGKECENCGADEHDGRCEGSP